MVIDLRQMAFATLWKKYEKKINNEEVKNEIRTGKATYKFADYCKVSTGKSTSTHYEKEGKIIEIDTDKIIANYCKENGINIVKDTKENYKITFTPSEKAEIEFNKMLNDLENSTHKNIAKVASKVKKHNTMKSIK